MPKLQGQVTKSFSVYVEKICEPSGNSYSRKLFSQCALFMFTQLMDAFINSQRVIGVLLLLLHICKKVPSEEIITTLNTIIYYSYSKGRDLKMIGKGFYRK